MATENGQTATAATDNRHTVADHPELEDDGVLRELVHALLHRVELLEQALGQR